MNNPIYVSVIVESLRQHRDGRHSKGQMMLSGSQCTALADYIDTLEMIIKISATHLICAKTTVGMPHANNPQ